MPVYKDRYYRENAPDKLYGGEFSPSDDKMLAFPTFAFSKHRKSIWASILEKAYAKYYGQFEVIEGKTNRNHTHPLMMFMHMPESGAGGHVCSALVDMAGGHGEQIDLTSSETKQSVADGSMWKNIRNFHENGYLMGCGTHPGKDTNVNSMGIVYGHAYSILNVVEGSDQNGTHRLVKLRNPHGKTEWKGK